MDDSVPKTPSKRGYRRRKEFRCHCCKEVKPF